MGVWGEGERKGRRKEGTIKGVGGSEGLQEEEDL